MRHSWLFGAVLFAGVWVGQILVLKIFPPGAGSPHLPLLAVLALGALGRTNLAQTLGFLWGLALDVMGLSLFGSQALLLAWTGFITGRVSRFVDADKWGTQQVLAALATIFLQTGTRVLDAWFRDPARPADGSLLIFVTGLIFNALAAPPVFWAVRRGSGAWRDFEREIS
ncbi:MAG: rod shape-determining protein MreD [Elusimicrobiota bacterium]